MLIGRGAYWVNRHLPGIVGAYWEEGLIGLSAVTGNSGRLLGRGLTGLMSELQRSTRAPSKDGRLLGGGGVYWEKGLLG